MARSTADWVREIRRALIRGGSRTHARGVQWFFKHEVRSCGWYTAPLRKFSHQTSKRIIADGSLPLLLNVSTLLFKSHVLEEKIAAVLMLEKLTAHFGAREFKLFESWLPCISSWADHDGLVYYLIGPMMLADPRRVARVFVWARSRDRWHRRAAAVSLVPATRQRKHFREIVRLSEMLLADEDDMVQKGLGWLLRETAKADPRRTVPYLMKLRGRTSRLVLRTACETLSKAKKKRVLG